MSGIIGSEAATTEQQPNAETPAQSKIQTSQPEEQAPKRKPGRPKKQNDDMRTSFIISSELVRKIKYISLMEDKIMKDIIDDALSLYVENWEQENGRIKLPKK